MSMTLSCSLHSTLLLLSALETRDHLLVFCPFICFAWNEKIDWSGEMVISFVSVNSATTAKESPSLHSIFLQNWILTFFVAFFMKWDILVLVPVASDPHLLRAGRFKILNGNFDFTQVILWCAANIEQLDGIFKFLVDPSLILVARHANHFNDRLVQITNCMKCVEYRLVRGRWRRRHTTP